MEAWKNWLIINAIVILVQKVQIIWNNWQIARTLLMKVKRAFDHILQTKLAQRVADLSIEDYSMR